GPEMNADLAVKVGRALGTFVSGGAVALARDPRLSGPMLARAAASGLMSAGCDVIDLGLVPTPCAQYFVAKSGQVKGAIVVTASHDPREFNGLKAIDSRGMEMRREDEEAIESIFFESRFHVAPWSEVGSIRADDAAIHRYTEGVLSKVDGDAIRKRAPSVVVDPGNGAGCVMTPYLLRSLGCRVLSLNAQPDGAFPGRLPEPTPDHLGDLIRVVREVHADIGIAHDGDADRATFVDDQGAFVVGDKSLALLARSAVKSRGGTVVTPVSTSTVVEDVVRAAGGTVVRTRVGSPIVARTMFETGAVFGGEENGGAIFPEHQFCRDGAMSAAKMLELLAHEGQALSALVAALPLYHIKKSNVSVPVERREAVLASIVELAKGRKVDTTDGVKILEKDGAVLVRPSGTEPIFRVYAEARTPARADGLADEGRVRRGSERAEGAERGHASVGPRRDGLSVRDQDRPPGEDADLAREGVGARDGQGGQEDDPADDFREGRRRDEGQDRDAHQREPVREHVRRPSFPSDSLLDAQRFLQGEAVPRREEAREQEEQEEEQPRHVAEDPDDHADDERGDAPIPCEHVLAVGEGAQDARQEDADEHGGDEIQGHRRGQKRVPVK